MPKRRNITADAPWLERTDLHASAVGAIVTMMVMSLPMFFL